MKVRRGRGPASPVTRVLLWCGVLAGPLFVGVFTVEGDRRPGYDPRRHPVSGLALGPRGQVQTANFFAAGVLTVAGAAGLRRAHHRRTCGGGVPALVAAAGVGLITSGVFPTDPVNGYPPGTPDHVTPATPVSVKHNLAAVPIFLGLPAAALMSARPSRRGDARGWVAFSRLAAGSGLVNVVLASAGFGGDRLAPRAGIHQRAAIATLLGWVTAACWNALRRPR